MRILHITPAYFADASYVGGGERYVHNLANAISQAAEFCGRSIEQKIVAFGPNAFHTDIEGTHVQVLKVEGIGVHPMSVSSPDIWKIAPLYDIIHIHQSLTYFGLFHASVGRTLNKTVIMTDLGGGDNKVMLDYGALNLADGLISISNFAGSLVSPHFRGPKAVILGPVNTQRFKGAVRHRRQDVLCVGRILPHKGIDQIVDALPQDLHLTVVGRRYDEGYYDLLRKLSTGKSVTFVERADDETLLELYRSCGLFVHASTHNDIYGRFIRKPELMGLTPLEAMSCGMPVIVSNTASLPELAFDSSFFKVFSNKAELSRILIAFRDNEWPTSDVSTQARTWVCDNYGLHPVGKKTIEFYDSVYAGMKK